MRAVPSDADELRIMISNADAELANASFELMPEAFAQRTPFGHISWGDHKVMLVGFNAPMPKEAWEMPIQAGNYDQDVKKAARAHQSHLLLYYTGASPDAFDAYVALATVACAVAEFGGVAFINPNGETSMPSLPASSFDGGVVADTWRSLPPLTLFAGFVKYDTGGDGVWMRTHGAHLMGLPDLAMLQPGHQFGERTFEMFNDILHYVRTSGAKLRVGETMQLGADATDMMRFRAPKRNESWLESKGPILVIEPAGRLKR